MKRHRSALLLLLLVTSNLLLETAGYGRYGACLNDWGVVMGMHPDLVNAGLNEIESSLPPALKYINGQITLPFDDLPVSIHATFNNVEIGGLTLTPFRQEFLAAMLGITFIRGSITLGVDGSESTKDMSGVEVQLETSVRSYRTVVTNVGVRYDVELRIIDGNAVRNLVMQAEPGTRHFISDALKIKFRQLLAIDSRYHILSFTIPDRNDDTRRFIPSEVAYIFNYDQSENGNHVYAALMAMPNMSVPTNPRKFVFANSELLLPGSQLTINIENHFILRFILHELQKLDIMSSSQFTITDACPGTITLTRSTMGFHEGADLMYFRLQLRDNRFHIAFKITKRNASPGIHLHQEYQAMFSMTYRAGRIRTNIEYENERVYSEQEDWLIAVQVLTLGLGAIVVHAILIPTMKAQVPSLVEFMNGFINEFQNGLVFKVGDIVLSEITSSQMITDSRGNLRFGAVSTTL